MLSDEPLATPNRLCNNMNPVQTAPKAPHGSSLIWVHTVCNIDYVRTVTKQTTKVVTECH